ncbi:MAG TPA: hypothetical protein VKA55_06250 [Gammaproteobacteria bacterium]|nr:hypothetical protein [Gammaproteobacteria bacterium]
MAPATKRGSALQRCLVISLVVALLAPLLNVLLGIGELGASPFLSLPGPDGERITLEIGRGGSWYERLQEGAFWEAWFRSALAYFVVALVASLAAVLGRGERR